MSEDLTTPFLPLGSVLKLKDTLNDTLYYFIVARAIAKNGNGEIVSRYKVAPYPFGDVPTQEVFSIEVEQIIEVLFEGFSDKKDEEFLENLLSQMNGSTESFPKDSEAEVEISSELEKIEDPFYSFRK
ncbi:DUF4176 domain-containing protein [Enterococcus faecalis]|uniref:DUF4176 domain-containing protein n=1 Tax=Enterococcus faecalis TaxID=1351 RepID=UPI00136CAD6E|nr:DUF4176 domain-containing protein [Enterococcus faecalis]NAA54089.1 DUF4176 domain-containing protein [Enterococcus faecalis]